MKHLKFLAALCCMLAVFTACEKNEPSDNTNGNGINTDQNGGNSNTGNDTDHNGGNSNTGSDNATGTANGHGYVDLGLPSGLKWATCNVGATKPEEYGNYYAWGETTPKYDYVWRTYKWATATYDAEDHRWYLATLTKYNTKDWWSGGIVDNKTVLDLEDDAAAVNWGGAWRMPTDAEWTELRTYCTWTCIGDYNGTGVAGQIVTSNINGNSIFLPAAGYRDGVGLDLEGSYGYFWSGSLNTDYPYYACYVVDLEIRYHNDRCYGQSVRPVLGE